MLPYTVFLSENTLSASETCDSSSDCEASGSSGDHHGASVEKDDLSAIPMDTGEDLPFDQASEALASEELEISIEERRASRLQQSLNSSPSRVARSDIDSSGANSSAGKDIDKENNTNSSSPQSQDMPHDQRSDSQATLDIGSESSTRQLTVAQTGISAEQRQSEENVTHNSGGKDSGGGGNGSAFSSFQFWRVPLPDIEVDVSVDPAGRATDTHGADETASDVVVSNSMQSDNETTACSSSLSTSNNQMSGLTESMEHSHITPSPSHTTTASQSSTSTVVSASTGAKLDSKIHTASVSTVSEGVEEYAANIGSTHILGHNVSQTTMAIKDGVVTGRLSELQTCNSVLLPLVSVLCKNMLCLS